MITPCSLQDHVELESVVESLKAKQTPLIKESLLYAQFHGQTIFSLFDHHETVLKQLEPMIEGLKDSELVRDFQ